MIHNYATCGGPTRCLYCSNILDETPEQACARMTAEDRERGLRAAAAGAAYVFRAGIHFHEERDMTNSVPDAYEPELARRRAACPDHARALAAPADDDKKVASMAAFREQVLRTAATSRAAAARPATSKIHLEPPNGYAIAIERMKEDSR